MNNMSETAARRVMPDPTTRVRVSDRDELDVLVIGKAHRLSSSTGR